MENIQKIRGTMKKKRTKEISFFDLLLFLTPIVATLFFIATQKEMNSLVINIICATIILLVLSWVYFNGINPVKRAMIELNRVQKEIQESDSTREQLLHKIINNESLFQHPILDRQFSLYQKELKRLNPNFSPESYSCDITDYINDTTMFEIINKQVDDQVGGIFTGLGILGTFIGLTLGLNKFNILQDTSAMQHGIEELMQGIRTAFYTSILGVISSILFNAVYSSISTKMLSVLDDFVSTFHEYVMPKANNESMSTLIGKQVSQKEVLDEIATRMMESFQNSMKETMNSAIENLQISQKENNEFITNTIATKMGQVYSNLSQEQGKQIEALHNVMDKFVGIASANQMEALQKIVDEFVQAMSGQLQNKFTLLGDTIVKLCDFQKLSAEKLDAVVLDISNRDEGLRALNESLENTVSNISGMAEYLHELQQKVVLMLGNIENGVKKYEEQAQRQNKYLAEMAQYQKSLEETGKIIAENDKQRKDDMHEYKESCKRSMNDLFELSAKQFETFASAAREALENTMSITKSNTENVTDTIEKAASDMVAVSEKVTELVHIMDQDMKMQIDNIFKQLEAKAEESIKGSFEMYDQCIAEALTHFSGTIKEIDSTTDEMNDSIETANKQIENAYRRQIEIIYGTGRTIQEGVNESIKMLEKTIKEAVEKSKIKEETNEEIFQ